MFSVCISQKQHCQTSCNFLYMLIMAVAQSFSDDNAIRYVLPVCGWRHVSLCTFLDSIDIIRVVSVFYLKAIVKETSVVTAKIDPAGRPHPSFRLPLRTKIELHFYGRWKESRVSPSISRYDVMAEEVSKSVYHEVTGRQSCRL